ncbi:MAG: AMP-binding protein, partial [Bradymonadales bacterium]|nr:AMP-binding protein [Bradymonadales bacterium]
MNDLPDLQTVPDYLSYWAMKTPEKPAFTFIGEDGREVGRRTYAELDRRARAVAGAMSASVKPGDRALIVIEPGIAFFEAYLGCLYAGVIAVPTYPPDPARLSRSIPRLKGITNSCQPKVVLVSEMIQKFAGVLRDQLGDLGEKPWLPVESVSTGLAETFRYRSSDPCSIAFLQYTSGSTGEPKGVMISHANLVHNIRYQIESIGKDKFRRCVSWLPPYHDLGLINTALLLWVVGSHTVHMSPATYLRKPVRWLEALHKYQATYCVVPPFALAYTLRKIPMEQRAEFNLSEVIGFGSAGEPLPAETAIAFMEGFQVSNLRTSVSSAYGLAEHTVYLCHSNPSSSPVRVFDAEALATGRLIPCSAGNGNVVQLVSNGQVGSGVDAVIVDPVSLVVCPEGTIGELWIHSDSVAQGYWQRPEATEQTFRAKLPGDDKTYLRTGDLCGTINGEMFITGRIKELLIVRGRNHYPLDVERTIEAAHPGIRPGCCAVFMGSDSNVVAIAELSKVPDKAVADLIRSQIQTAVAQFHGIQLSDVALIEPRSLPKAMNGKMARNETRTAYLSNALPRVDGGSLLTVAAQEPEPPQNHYRSDEERFLAQCLEQYLGRVPDLDQPCSATGLDSIQAFQLACDIEERFGSVIQPQRFIGHHTWREALASSSRALIDTRVTAEMVPISKSMPATRMQTWIMRVHEAV